MSIRLVAPTGRASVSKTECCRFESDRACQKKRKNMKKIKQNFINDVQAEFKKIEWPKKDVVVKSSLITIFMVVFFTIYIAGADFLLSKFIFSIQS
jgi:preprotein translocase SecE subunit